jgi:hypothetical protein
MSKLRTIPLPRPSLLRVASPSVLAQLLLPHQGFLAERDFNLQEFPTAPDPARASIQLLSIVLNAGPQLPPDLVEALFICSEIAVEGVREDLTAACIRLGLNLPAETSAEDQAIQIWLRCKETARRLYVEQLPNKMRSFETYVAVTHRGLQKPNLSAETIERIRKSMEIFFVNAQHPPGLKLFSYQRGEHEVWFLIRRGGKYRNMAAITATGDSSVVGLFPEDFDLVMLNTKSEETRIHAGGVRATEAYRKTFGFEIYGRETHFEEFPCYSLAPLREKGPDALIATDCDEIRWVSLVELKVKTDLGKTTFSGPDVFRYLDEQKSRIEPGHEIVSAIFRFQFHEDRKPRRVTIKAGNSASYERDDDSVVIDEWLRRRGFVVDPSRLKPSQNVAFLGAA